MLSQFFKSIIDMERASVVICDLEHRILYMNPAAIRNYSKRGGKALVGKNLMNCHNEASRKKIEEVIAWFGESTEHNMIHTFVNEKENKDGYMVALRDEDGALIGYYEKHEYRNPETAEFYDYSRSLI